MLGDEFYYRQTLAQLDELGRQYAGTGASERAASWICDQLGFPEAQAVHPSIARKAA